VRQDLLLRDVGVPDDVNRDLLAVESVVKGQG